MLLLFRSRPLSASPRSPRSLSAPRDRPISRPANASSTLNARGATGQTAPAARVRVCSARPCGTRRTTARWSASFERAFREPTCRTSSVSLTDRTAWQTAAYVRSLGRSAAQPLRGDVTRGGALYAVGRLRRLPRDRRTRPRGRSRVDGHWRAARSVASARVDRESRGDAPVRLSRGQSGDEAGREIRGIRLTEDVFWILIRDATGAAHVLQKSELSRLDRELEATLMPSYATRFSDAELDDVVAYLSNLRGPS